ncbi:MFS transporter [Isobaculum melis]|uniref:Predicted arabinose efflux permease, MFS family n=1 Tax=Isobaculum melis TaxID=142588 RepID=A0A1H9T2U6_9LACT|nr:MFS transporter [Isobaculum melis]SER91461.1 Predicted arabinose efflux permease, MFS family [Isobaculum melis]
MNKITKLSLLSVSLLVVSGGAIAGNIPAIMIAYPTIHPTLVELITTIPSLFIISTVPFSHRFARKFGYKLAVQIGIGIVLGAGIIPVFAQSFWLLFFSRILFGIGIGLFNPLLFSLAGKLYQGKELSSVIGFQSAFEGIGGMVITFTVGQLLIMNWRSSFLAYLLALQIFLLFTWFVPDVSLEKESKQNKQEKQTINPSTYGYIALLILVVTIYMSVTVKITSLLLEKGFGNATDGSNFLALVGLGAMTAGALFGSIVTLTKKRTLPISFFVLGISMFMIAFAQNLVSVSFAAILCGFSFRTFIPYLFNEVNQDTKGNSEKSTSLLLIGFNIGAAFAPISISILGNILPSKENTDIFIAEGIIMLLLAFGTTISIIKKKQKINGGKST